jgi:hypothetical protein
MWTISLFVQPLTLMLLKFSRRCNLPHPDQSRKFHLVITPSPILLPMIHLTQLYAVETFDPYPAEIPLNVQMMSQILEDQQVLRFNCLGDFFPQMTISGPSLPVATLLHRVL